MSENKRLIEVINFLTDSRKVFNDADFANIVGKPKSFISEAKAGKKTITERFVLKIEQSFPEINGSYILTGEGSMLRTSPPAPFKKITESEVEAVSMDSYTEVPFFDLAVSAGLPCLQGQAGWLDTRLVPARFAGKDIAVVRVSGDSMDDGTARSICHGDELVVKFEPLDLAGGLPIRTRLFVVDTTEGAVVKQIAELNRSEGFVLLRSFNPSYPDYSIPLSEVNGFYSVQCFIYRAVRF